jgi:hypothetical protein
VLKERLACGIHGRRGTQGCKCASYTAQPLLRKMDELIITLPLFFWGGLPVKNFGFQQSFSLLIPSSTISIYLSFGGLSLSLSFVLACLHFFLPAAGPLPVQVVVAIGGCMAGSAAMMTALKSESQPYLC